MGLGIQAQKGVDICSAGLDTVGELWPISANMESPAAKETPAVPRAVWHIGRTQDFALSAVTG
jgi:hypothetical protein